MPIVTDVLQILRQAQQNAYYSINRAMVEAYWLVGKRIVEEEQQGESKAAYGKYIIRDLSEQLQKEFGKGFSVRNIEQMRIFFLEYQIAQTVSAQSDMISETVSRIFKTPDFQLSWSHYQILIRIEDKDERRFYEIEAIQNKWSLRELKRQFDSALYMLMKIKQLALFFVAIKAKP